MGGVLLGWARAAEGAPGEGIAEIREFLAGMDAGGPGLVRTFHLALLAEAQRSAGQPREALASIDRALSLVELMDERFWEPELYRLRGELLFELSPKRAAEARAELEEALAVARAQRSEPLVARALDSLRRHDDSR